MSNKNKSDENDFTYMIIGLIGGGALGFVTGSVDVGTGMSMGLLLGLIIDMIKNQKNKS